MVLAMQACMQNAPVFELPKFRRRDKKQQQKQPSKQDEPLPWHEGEPDLPEPPFLPAA